MKLLQGDCLEKLKELPENSVDSIVTDPPYGLSFMGKKWDYDVPSVEIWKECLRVLKPGAFLLSFSGSRTYHRMAVNIEDAGFEIRDQIMWLYGSGFPKSLNIGKQVDKIEGNEREVVGENKNARTNLPENDIYKAGIRGKECRITKGNSDWEGWGTAMKPAHEPIVVARKPLSEKNVALNVLKYGTGGINIDGCRIGNEIIKSIDDPNKFKHFKEQDGRTPKEHNFYPKEVQGRFPANIILDEEAGKILDEQTGELKSGTMTLDHKAKIKEKGIYGEIGTDRIKEYNGSSGGASRFFYCAKASKSERNLGCEELEEQESIYPGANTFDENGNRIRKDGSIIPPLKSKNNHPTVKPIKLMQYLVRLVTPKGATCLDCFMGSGSTGIACIKEEINFIGIEREEEYIKIAKARIENTTAFHGSGKLGGKE